MHGHDELAHAWRRLTLDQLLDLVQRVLGWEGWRQAGSRIEGPCPVGCSKGAAERNSAFCYPRDDGGPPWIRCHHKASCGFTTSIFDALAERLGSRGEAAALIKARAMLTVPAAIWPHVEPLVLRPNHRKGGP
jgi:hypothetical protein